MKWARRFQAAAAWTLVILPVGGWAVSGPEADVIVTAAPKYAPLAALGGGERFPQGAQLLLIHRGKAEPLVAGFAASADANVSFDGKTVVFAGKKTAADKWQIWEMTLADGHVRRVVETATDAIRPLYLPSLMPGGRVVYAVRTGMGFALEQARAAELPEKYAALDTQAAVVRVTYLPGSAVPADVLTDGRILFEAGFPLGAADQAKAELYLVYSDGSGVESYRCDHGRARWGGRQLKNGDAVFTHGGSLARFTSPLAHEAPVAAPHAEYAGGIAEKANGEWLVSARAAGAGTHFALKAWKPGTAALEPMLAESGMEIVEPVVVAARTRPNRHPSALHTKWNYANLLALDARLSREGDLKATPARVRVETMDADGRAVVNGSAPVEADGSFFVQVQGNRPMRFALLNEKGAVVRQEQGWFYIRNGEQRICVGCHTGPERGSENRVPGVLLRTTTPVDLMGTTASEGQSK
jgi:hypothetical protein